jgi:hypothetical protein
MTNMEVVPQVSLELHLRGNPPALETIKYSNSANRSDVASGLQQRSLNKAVATALTLFAAHGSCQRLILFRIHYQETKPSFVRAILSAKHEPQGRSQIRDLAHGLFFQLFLKPTGPGHYLDIDLTRLQPDSVKIILDGQQLDFGFIPAHRMISLSVFTRASALNFWARLRIRRVAELWMIRTSY